MRGGTYGPVSVRIQGTSDASHATWTNYPGEVAIIDGGSGGDNTPAILWQGNGFVWLQGDRTGGGGIKVTSSDTTRVSTTELSTPPDINRPDACKCWQHNGERRPGIRLIDVSLIDARQGFSWWEECPNSEVSGVITGGHGWTAPDRGHGPGIYLHSKDPDYKLVRNSIFLPSFSVGLQAYGSGAINMDNVEAAGNIFVNSGALDPRSGSHQLSMGTYGGPTGKGWFVHDNSFYRTGQAGGTDVLIPYDPTSLPTSPVIQDNYIASSVQFGPIIGTATITGNTFAAPVVGIAPGFYPANTFTNGVKPTANVVKIYPDPYAKGCNVAVFNWEMSTSVDVDLSSCGFSAGDGYIVRSGGDYFGADVATGSFSVAKPGLLKKIGKLFSSGPLASPIATLSTSPSVVKVAVPVAWTAPPNWCPEFCIYVVVPALGSPSPTPTPTPTVLIPSPTPTLTPTPAPTFAPPPDTPTPTLTPSPTVTATVTQTTTKTRTPTPIPTITSTPGPPTATPLPPTMSPTRTISLTRTLTATPSWTKTRTKTPTPTPNDHQRICDLEKKVGIGPCGKP